MDTGKNVKKELVDTGKMPSYQATLNQYIEKKLNAIQTNGIHMKQENRPAV